MKRIVAGAVLLLVIALLFFLCSGNDGASAKIAGSDVKPAPSIPTLPAKEVASPTSIEIARSPAAALKPASKLGSRLRALANGGGRGKISRPALEAFLEQRGRTAPSLIAAWQESGDAEYLREAAANFPDDAQVAFAMLDERFPAEERAAALELFKRNAPDNPLANYLAAREHFKNGHPDEALREITAAAEKTAFDEYVRPFLNEREALYLAVGLEPVEAKVNAMYGLLLPYLAQLQQLSKDLVAQTTAAATRGDAGLELSLARSMAEMARQLNSEHPSTLIAQLVGISIEMQMLAQLDATRGMQILGYSLDQRKAEIEAQRAEIRALSSANDITQGDIDDEMIVAYLERAEANGELDALRWLANLRQSPSR